MRLAGIYVNLKPVLKADRNEIRDGGGTATEPVIVTDAKIADGGETTVVFLCEFWKDERGQDLIEYTLLMAFVALASAALFMGAGGKVKAIWTVANTQLANANTAAQGGS